MSLQFSQKQLLQLLGLAAILAVGLAASYFLTAYVDSNAFAKELVGRYGLLGAYVVAFVAGLSLFVPIPASTFVPVFTAGGLSLTLVIVMLVAGTVTADMLSYVAGRFGKRFVSNSYPDMYEKILALYQKHHAYIPWFVLIYASVVPAPNEAFLLPLGMLGVPLRLFFVPLVIGTVILHTTLSFGIERIFDLLI